MDRDRPPHTGQRIARYRKARGLPQEQLAAQAHVSLSLLQKVETGIRPATDRLLEAIAPVLRVSVAELAGRPADPGLPAPRTALAQIHAALLRCDLPAGTDEPVRPLAQLREDIERVTALRARGAYPRLGELLPGVMDHISRAAQAACVDDRPEAYSLLTHACFAAHAMAYKLGDDGLAALAEQQITWASARTGNPLLGALAAWTRGHSLLATGGANWDVGLGLLERARRDLDGDLPALGAEGLSVYGALLLREAMIAARSRRRGLAQDRVSWAQELVDRGARDVNPYSLLTAGPTNTRIVAAAVAVELGDASAALGIARGLRIPAGFSRVRAAHHFTDLAVPLTWEGKVDQAVSALLRAERYAAQQTLWHPTTRVTVGRLLMMRRHPSPKLQGLTSRILLAGAPSPLA